MKPGQLQNALKSFGRAPKCIKILRPDSKIHGILENVRSGLPKIEGNCFRMTPKTWFSAPAAPKCNKNTFSSTWKNNPKITFYNCGIRYPLKKNFFPYRDGDHHHPTSHGPPPHAAPTTTPRHTDHHPTPQGPPPHAAAITIKFWHHWVLGLSVSLQFAGFG